MREYPIASPKTSPKRRIRQLRLEEPRWDVVPPKSREDAAFRTKAMRPILSSDERGESQDGAHMTVSNTRGSIDE